MVSIRPQKTSKSGQQQLNPGDVPTPAAGLQPGDSEAATTDFDSALDLHPSVFRSGEVVAERFRIVRYLARGGMGELYEAEDLELHERVALKTILPKIAVDERLIHRFKREVYLARQVTHPNVCRIFDLYHHKPAPAAAPGQDVLLLAMELLHGESLAERLRRERRLSTAEVLPLVRQMAAGLVAAHRVGVVHRDFKSHNVMLVKPTVPEQEVRAVITDFGLARRSSQEERTSLSMSDLGEISGTPAYMAPEQVEGGPVTPATDVYALGVVMYEMVTGVWPFVGDTPLQTAIKRLQQPAPTPRTHLPDLDARWEAVILRCLERDPAARFASPREVVAALEGEPGEARIAAQSRRWKWIALGVTGMLVLALAIGLWLFRSRPTREPKQRRLTSNSSEVPVTAAAISPDGKYLAYADDSGVYVRLTETGESHPLSAVPAGFTTSALSWFPDGTRVVASGTAANETAFSIWAISILGGTPLKLRDDARTASISPNGSQTAFLSGNATEIWLMGRNGGEPRRFVAADKGDRFIRLAWFPDSERLGYLRQGIGPRRSEVGIMSRGLKDSQSGAVFADARLMDFCILPDRRLIVSLTDSAVNARDSGLWEIRTDLRTGQAISSPRRLANWTGSALVDLSATADGKHIVCLKGTAQYDAFIAELEGNGLRLKPPWRLTLSDSLNFPGAWAPDSSAILFSSDRNGNLDIFKQALDQRPEDECDPTVSPDGAWILYFNLPLFGRVSAKKPVTLRRVPFSGGTPQLVLNERGVCYVDCARSPSKLCVMDQRVGDELIFYALDPVQGKGRELTRIAHSPSLHFWHVSPDGSNIAVATAERGGGIRRIQRKQVCWRPRRFTSPLGL